jgi:maltose O-acetyltransferase
MNLLSGLFGFARHVRDAINRQRRETYIEKLKSRGLKIGERVSFEERCFLDPSHCYLISIGDRVIFAPNVRLIAHDASTRFVVEHTRLGRISIGSGCFIGDSVIVLPGVSIGDDCIVGAGSVVTRDIPSNSVAAGNPARVVCSTEEFRAKHQQRIRQGAAFGESYARENLDPGQREELLRAVEKGPTYVI